MLRNTLGSISLLTELSYNNVTKFNGYIIFVNKKVVNFVHSKFRYTNKLIIFNTMIRLTHENMATAFQITTIIFIFTYTANPVQNKIKQGTIKASQVVEPYKAEKSLMPQIKTISHSFNTLKNNAVNHNFSWHTAQSEMMPGTERAVTKRERIIPAAASFSNFNRPVNN